MTSVCFTVVAVLNFCSGLVGVAADEACDWIGVDGGVVVAVVGDVGDVVGFVVGVVVGVVVGDVVVLVVVDELGIGVVCSVTA